MAAGESFLDKIKKSPKVAVYWGKLALAKMPPPVQNRLNSRRHLKIVTEQIALHTNPGYLEPRYTVTDTIADTVPINWLRPERTTPFPEGGLEPGAFTEHDRASVLKWLDAYYLDSDQDLIDRLDGMSDEYGRFRTALRIRLALNSVPPTNNPANPSNKPGRVLVDARCLQAPQYATRGIGKYAYELLETLRARVGDDRLPRDRLPEPVLLRPAQEHGGQAQVPGRGRPQAAGHLREAGHPAEGADDPGRGRGRR